LKLLRFEQTDFTTGPEVIRGHQPVKVFV
jgi:hypothetical protein